MKKSLLRGSLLGSSSRTAVRDNNGSVCETIWGASCEVKGKSHWKRLIIAPRTVKIIKGKILIQGPLLFIIQIAILIIIMIIVVTMMMGRHLCRCFCFCLWGVSILPSLLLLSLNGVLMKL